jgi:hypothetical protein
MVIVVGILIIVFLVILYYIYKNVKKKIMINRDYNRKISKNDLKVRKDLETLRNQLYRAKDPVSKNEIIDKIQAIVNVNSGDKEEDE